MIECERPEWVWTHHSTEWCPSEMWREALADRAEQEALAAAEEEARA